MARVDFTKSTCNGLHVLNQLLKQCGRFSLKLFYDLTGNKVILLFTVYLQIFSMLISLTQNLSPKFYSLHYNLNSFSEIVHTA